VTLEVRRALGLITVQDLGRPGRMHEAMPRGGALVPERLIAANRAAGNPDDAPALEVLGALTVRAVVAHEVATDTTAARALAAGDELVVTSEPRRVAYLAVRGGVASPLVLGGRGALLCAGLGGLLRSGQAIEPAGLPAVPPIMPAAEPADAAIRLLAGPDPAQFLPGALEILLGASYRVLPSSNRVGTRLDGAKLPRTAAPEVSRPMVIGAIEVPGDGLPIVLGPEHPTTGGYPIVAVVAHADLGRLCSIRLGGTVRFTRA
jgi:allophanate hydrolase subunit 2